MVTAESPGLPVEIRQAQPADGPALCRLIEQIHGETEFLGKPDERMPWADRAEAALRDMREQDSAVYFLGLAGGEPVGFLGAFPGWLERTRGAIFIGHVGLREAWRGRGLGTRLFQAIEAWARARHAHRLELRVDEANARGLALYRKQGFVVEGRIPQSARLGGVWHAHFWMAKALRGFAEPPIASLPRQPAERPRLKHLTFRAVEPGDAAALCAWERQLLGELPAPLKRMSEVVEEARMRAFLAEQREPARRLMWACFAHTAAGAPMIGYVTAWPEPGERMRHDAFLTLNVLPSCWGAGVGRRLAERLAAWAREQRFRRLSTAVLGHNARGLAFAEAQGFRPEVFSPRYALVEGHTVDRVRLGRLLEDSGG